MMKRHVFLLLLCAAAPAASAQEVRSCLQADGTVVYTDAVCAADQTEKPAAGTVATPSPALSGRHRAAPPPPACNASVEDLQYSVRSAIEMQDINELAKHYHWPDVSDAQAETVLDRLEKLLQRPLIDVQLMYPAAPEPIPAEPADEASEPDGYSEYPMTAPAPERPPYGLKVLQYRTRTASDITATPFRLQRHFDCWWIRY